MSIDAATALELLQKLNSERTAYLESLEKSTELLSRLLASSGGVLPQNTTTQVPFNGLHYGRQLPPLTSDALRRNTIHGLPFVPEVESVHRTASAFSDDDSSSDGGESQFASTPLAKEEYTIDGLRKHIEDYKWTESGKKILHGIWDNRELLKRPSLFPTLIKTPDGLEISDDRSHMSHASIYDVAGDGLPSTPLDSAKEVSRSQEIWNRLRSVNVDDYSAPTVGKIICVREPSPLLYAALHFTLHKHVDVDELFAHLVDHDPVLVRPNDPFSDDPRHKRTFAVNFEYFTIIAEGCVPAHWQRSDVSSNANQTHIAITRCSAVIALSLEGSSSGKVKAKDRRATRKYGEVFDPFSPWRVIVIQAYPDWETTIEEERARKHVINGPEAFLNTLRSEYHDAAKRLEKVQRAIADLVQAPPDFIFNLKTRDKLLFEDDDFTYSRRYFWAMQTLEIMNQDIADMLDGYYDFFNDQLWHGKHPFVWKGHDDTTTSPRHIQWRKRMALLRSEIEVEIRRLQNIETMNNKQIKIIKGLRDNLFSGTSVMESRKSVEIGRYAVEQGHNIRTLTLLTLFFLPLTFVTSIFGMTDLDPNEPLTHYAFVTIALCIPTYIIILSLNTERGLAWWSRVIHDITTWTTSLRGGDRTIRLQKDGDRQSSNDMYELNENLPRRRPGRSRSAEVNMLSRSGGLLKMNSPPISRVATTGREVPDEDVDPMSVPYSPINRKISYDLPKPSTPTRKDGTIGNGQRAETDESEAKGKEETKTGLPMAPSVSYENRFRGFLGRIRSQSRGEEEVDLGTPC